MTTAPIPASRPDSDVEYDTLEVFPDEVRIGDVLGGLVVTGVHASEHYRQTAVRYTLFTDPYMLPDGTKSEECGRMVVIIDRDKMHRIPIERPRR